MDTSSVFDLGDTFCSEVAPVTDTSANVQNSKHFFWLTTQFNFYSALPISGTSATISLQGSIQEKLPHFGFCDWLTCVFRHHVQKKNTHSRIPRNFGCFRMFPSSTTAKTPLDTVVFWNWRIVSCWIHHFICPSFFACAFDRWKLKGSRVTIQNFAAIEQKLVFRKLVEAW